MRLLAALAALVWTAPAFAGVVLVPTPPLTGDGETPSTIRLYVDSGARIRVKADAGKVTQFLMGEDGIATILYVAPSVTSPRTVAFKVSGGGEETTIEVPIVPPFTGSLDIEFDPPLLPSPMTAVVRIRPTGASPVAPEGRRFQLAVSAGTIDMAVPAGDGTWVARYTPPKGLATPLPVVVSAADAAAPDRIYGQAVLPVTLRRSVSFDVKPGSSNVLRVGSRSYGPIVAAPSGKVAFDVDLDPREPTGDLRSINADTSKEDREVKLPGATAPQIVFLQLPPTLPAVADLQVPLRVAVVGPDGEPLSDEAPRLVASRGSFSPASAERDAWRTVYTPPTTPGEVTLTAEFGGTKAEKKIRITGSLPTISLSSDPVEIAKAGTSFKVTAYVKDAQGTAVPGRAPTFSAEGATSGGTPKDGKDGSYAASWKVASATKMVRVRVAPPVEASGMAPARLLAWPVSATVAANGLDTTTITVVAVDMYGLPVPNIDLRLGVPRGDGTLPPTAKTDARGIARVTYKSGKSPGIGAIRVEGGGLVTETAVSQVKDGLAVLAPPGGDATAETLLGRWRAASPEILVMRVGAVAPSGPPTAMAVSSVPPFTTPGAAILVTVRVTDASGKGAGGQKLAITASPATVGTVTDNRDGTYTFPVMLAAGQDGPVSVVVTTGGVTAGATLPTLQSLGGQSAMVSGGAGAAGRATAPRARASVGEYRPLRLGVTFHSSHGEYGMESNGEDQLVGLAVFDTPGAGFWGLGLDLGWIATQQNWGGIGLDLHARAQLEGFAVTDEEYFNVPRDVIAGVAYKRVLAGPLAVRGVLGAHYTTAMVFRYGDAGRTEAELLNKPLFGVRAAAAGEIEAGPVWVSLELAETFAPFPIDTRAEALLDYEVADSGLTVRVGGSWDLRTMAFETDDAGEADVWQQHFTARAGLGFAR